MCSKLWNWGQRTVRWGTNHSGHLDMKWYPYPIRDPWFVYSVGYVTSNESGQGPGFIWRALACYLPRFPSLCYLFRSKVLNNQAMFQGRLPVQKQFICWEFDLLAMEAPRIIVITICSNSLFTKPGRFPWKETMVLALGVISSSSFPGTGYRIWVIRYAFTAGSLEVGRVE